MTLAYVGSFLFCMLFIGWTVLALLNKTLLGQLDSRLNEAAADIIQSSRSELNATAELERKRAESKEFLYRLDGHSAHGETLIPASITKCQSFDAADMPEDGRRGDAFRACAAEGQGYRITAASDIDVIEDTNTSVQLGFLGSGLAALLFALAAGRRLSGHYLRRLDSIRSTAASIADGDQNARLPLTHQGDEFDRVAGGFNAMLDRQRELIEAHKHSGSAIAHDIRTPLTRLRNKIETRQRRLGSALAAELTAEVDALLSLASALLRLAEVDNTADQKHWRTLDLAQQARDVVEAFEPSFSDANGKITYKGATAAFVHADQNLIQQLIANLVENALQHSGEKPNAEVSVSASGAALILGVTDSGPGLPQSQIERFEKPFYRLERSYDSSGTGLGLALAAAIARRHKTKLTVANGDPGLFVSVALPARRNDAETGG